jgi:hypothetical protein
MTKKRLGYSLGVAKLFKLKTGVQLRWGGKREVRTDRTWGMDKKYR